MPRSVIGGAGSILRVPSKRSPRSSVVIAAAGDPEPFNVALASSGSTITVNAESAGSKENMIDGSRVPGGSFATNGLQINGTGQWMEIDFGASRTITEINFISGNGNDFNNSGEPTLSTDGAFAADNHLEMFYWNGSSWVTLGDIDNSLQWKQWTFSAVSTTAIRMEALAVAAGALYALEMEAIGF